MLSIIVFLFICRDVARKAKQNGRSSVGAWFATAFILIISCLVFSFLGVSAISIGNANAYQQLEGGEVLAFNLIVCVLYLTVGGLIAHKIYSNPVESQMDSSGAIEDSPRTASGNAASPTSRVEKYRAALAYLDNCGAFNEGKLCEFNRIAGSPFSESELEEYVRMANMSIGGMEALKQTVLSVVQEGVRTFEQLETIGIKA